MSIYVSTMQKVRQAVLEHHRERELKYVKQIEAKYGIEIVPSVPPKGSIAEKQYDQRTKAAEAEPVESTAERRIRRRVKAAAGQ